MTKADALLAKAFAADLPPARDPDFTLAVITGMARRQLWADLVSAAVAAVVASLVLWAFWPVLAAALDPILLDAWQAVAPAVAALAVAVTVIAFIMTSGNERRVLA